MFWRMAGLSTASPVETILDKDNFTLEELLDEDEVIQECKALNARLINFLRQREQVEQLIRFIVEEASEDAEKRRTFKLPFIACELITCEVDIILKTLVEDEELMTLLFAFLDPKHSHSTLLAGYFSKVVICLLMRKTVSLMDYIHAHQEIIRQLVDLVGITSIMEVLIRLIGVDEHIYANYKESMSWLEESDVLEMIVDKFGSSDSPEVHANAAETLCAITRYAPPGIAAKITSPSLIGRLFHNALEAARPKSVLVNSLSVCISLLDPKRQTFGTFHAYNRQFSQAPSITANPETIEGMLGSFDNLLKMLDVSSEEGVLPTTYGKLQPPLGKQRLKIVEFVSVLLSIGNENAEKEVIRLGAVKRILDMFFEYPYNNFLHHHVESIILSCYESKKSVLIEHLLRDCNLVGRVLEAEKHPLLSSEPSMPTAGINGSQQTRIGNIGHLTRISNKVVKLGNTNSEVQALLQENIDWVEWYVNVLSKRNAVENVHQWVCGRPTALQDRGRDSDDDYQDRDYDIAALTNNLSQAFQYGIYSNDMDEAQGSVERDEEDVYFDDESAEVVISSSHIGDDHESGSLFTNSNWFAFEENRVNDKRPADSVASPSPGDGEPASSINDEVNGGEDDLIDTATSLQEPATASEAPDPVAESSLPALAETGGGAVGEQTEWVQWRETSNSGDASDEADNEEALTLPNGVEESANIVEDTCPSIPDPSPTTTDTSERNGETNDVGVPDSSVDAGGADGVDLTPSRSTTSHEDINSPKTEQSPEPIEHEKNDSAQGAK